MAMRAAPTSIARTATAPVSRPILELLDSKGLKSGCAPDHYYLVNNYAAGYDLDGHPQPIGPHNYNYPAADRADDRRGAVGARRELEVVYGRSRSGGPRSRDANVASIPRGSAPRTVQRHRRSAGRLRSRHDSTRRSNPGLPGLSSFYRDLERGRLPAVSFVVPKNLDSAHPGYSVVASYENLVRAIVERVQRHPRLWSHAAIIATTDEGGGHFDSGYIQVLDFFGDGPRIPLLIISPYARRGHVDHTYNDHASILKFIERNWGLAPLSARSRDNLPDPVADAADPYRPRNSPAVGDLMTLFNF